MADYIMMKMGRCFISFDRGQTWRDLLNCSRFKVAPLRHKTCSDKGPLALIFMDLDDWSKENTALFFGGEIAEDGRIVFRGRPQHPISLRYVSSPLVGPGVTIEFPCVELANSVEMIGQSDDWSVVRMFVKAFPDESGVGFYVDYGPPGKRDRCGEGA